MKGTLRCQSLCLALGTVGAWLRPAEFMVRVGDVLAPATAQVTSLVVRGKLQRSFLQFCG
jgi:hypothetical protein